MATAPTMLKFKSGICLPVLTIDEYERIGDGHFPRELGFSEVIVPV